MSRITLPVRLALLLCALTTLALTLGGAPWGPQ
jgi:hypothetical protein